MLGLAPYFNVLLGKGFLSISENLVLKVIKGERIVHGKFGLSGVCPSGFEGDGEVADAVAFDRER